MEAKYSLFIKLKPPWRNGLECWTSNSKVVGSSPTGGGIFPFQEILKVFLLIESSFVMMIFDACRGQLVGTAKHGKRTDFYLYLYF